ncbi:MAG: FMN-binding protein [Spirochaetaceae bacterium]|jgi:hypothetical protein|nr:FMN-binding protein [Spirochaetaceae bacterium]
MDSIFKNNITRRGAGLRGLSLLDGRRKRLVIFFVLALFCTFFFSSCLTLFTPFELYIEGESQGAAEGRNGEISVIVTTGKFSIKKIVVKKNKEDPQTGGAAIRELSFYIINNNSTDVDVISGATETSEGFIKAVENALEQLKKTR